MTKGTYTVAEFLKKFPKKEDLTGLVATLNVPDKVRWCKVCDQWEYGTSWNAITELSRKKGATITVATKEKK